MGSLSTTFLFWLLYVSVESLVPIQGNELKKDTQNKKAWCFNVRA